MNLSTIEQGEELLKKCLDTKRYDMEVLEFFRNHASELLQAAREVEESKAVDKTVDRVVNKYGDAMKNLAKR